jgi:hypothetical protein
MTGADTQTIQSYFGHRYIRHTVRYTQLSAKPFANSSQLTNLAGRGEIFALTGKAWDAVRALTSGITSLRSTGASLYEPRHLWHLAMAYAELGHLGIPVSQSNHSFPPLY